MIDNEFATGYIAGVIGREKQYSVRDIARPPKLPAWHDVRRNGTDIHPVGALGHGHTHLAPDVSVDDAGMH